MSAIERNPIRISATFLLAATISVSAAAQDLSNWYQVIGGAWDVPVETIADMYPLLQASANKESNAHQLRSLSEFTVQYQGVIVGNARLVKLGGDGCSAAGWSPDTLRDRWKLVYDGGNCYFSAIYDPFMKRIVSFHFNGYA